MPGEVLVDTGHDTTRHGQCAGITGTVSGYLHMDTTEQLFMALEVLFHRVYKRTQAQCLLFKHQIPDSHQGVRHVGKPDARHTGAVVAGATLSHIPTTGQGACHQRRQQWGGTQYRMGLSQIIIQLDRLRYEKTQLLLKGLVKLIEGGEGRRITGRLAGSPVHERVPAIMQPVCPMC